MSSQVRLRLILVLVIGMIAYWLYSMDHQPSPPPPEVKVSAIEQKSPSRDSQAPKAQVEDPKKADASKKNAEDNLKKAIEELHRCLPPANVEAPKDLTASFDNWIQHTQSERGPIVMTTEEWRSTHLQMPNGEKRNIRIEYEMNEDDEYVKKLKYSMIDANGVAVQLPLSPDQSENPRDDMVAALEREGDITLSEKAHRVYFKDGTEVFAIEKNGALNEIEMNKNGKVFRCWQMDESGPCECL